MDNNNKPEFKPVNLPLTAGILFQIGVAAQMLWGWYGNAWHESWLCTYIAVILIMEAAFWNAAIEKGNHPIKALYPILIMIGFAFFFTVGFMYGGWAFSWIGLVFAAVAILVIIPIDRSVSKKFKSNERR